MQVLCRSSQQNGDWLFWWGSCERFGYGIPPELHAHHADGGCACSISDAGDIDIEGADSEVSIAGGLWYEGL